MVWWVGDGVLHRRFKIGIVAFVTEYLVWRGLWELLPCKRSRVRPGDAFFGVLYGE